MQSSNLLIKAEPTTSLSASVAESNHIALNLSLSLSVNRNLNLALRPYQIDTLNQVDKVYKEGKNRLLVSLPTGVGKTIIFSHLVINTIGRSLVLAHRDELIEQAADKIRMVLPSADIGIVKAERNQTDRQIIIASIQTLTRESRLEQLEKNFSTIIIDEAHHACSKSYKKVLHSLGSFAATNAPLTLGVTATPERGDGVGLDSVFQEIVYHRSLLEMISEQYLSDLTWQDVKLDIDLDTVETRAGDFIESELIKALTNSDTPRQILYAFKTYANNRKTLIFVPGVTLARSIATLFKENNIACESIDGKLSSKERKDILNRLHTGQTQVVVNCMLLVEGFDEPTIDCILFARPTKSKSFYLQMLGRGTRLHPNKTDCLVIDLVGLSKRHNLITLPSLFGIANNKLKKKSLLAITEEIEQEKQIHQTQIQALDLLAEQQKALAESEKQTEPQLELENQLLDTTTTPTQHTTIESEVEEPLTQNKTVKKALRFNWLKLSEKCYALSISNNGILFLISGDNIEWSVIWREDSKTSLIAKGLSLEYAMGIAQDFVRNLPISVLIDIDANWRTQVPSDKQLILLHDLNVSYPDNITRGLASDLIAIHFGKKELDNYQKTISESNNIEISPIEVISFNNQSIQNNQNNQISEDAPATDNSSLVYKPTFAKCCFPELPNNFIKYQHYKLNNYMPQGDIYSQTNKSQSLALFACKEYVNQYLNQEVGIVFSGESGVGKTHLAVAILNELTNQYNLDTLFCDYRLLVKQIYETNFSSVIGELLSKISQSQIILLDGFIVKNNNSATVRKLMARIIDCCCRDSYYDKKLILTTRHHSYSSSYHEKESLRLSLGDILAVDTASKLYDYCHYLEISAINKALDDRLPSDFSPIADIASNIVLNIVDFKKAV